MTKLLDWLAVKLGTWAIKRMFGADCATDVRDDYPGENVQCISCDAKRVLKVLKEILE